MAFPTLSDPALQLLLNEDAPYGDVTTEALGIGTSPGELRFLSRQPMVVCGTEEAARLFELADARVNVHVPSGTHASPGQELLTASGGASGLLLAWKVAQNLVEWSSGIASATARLVAAAECAGKRVPIACTRKAFPGTRYLASKAVVAGGGTLHRLGLSESLLVFPEHRVFVEHRARNLDWLGELRSRERERRLTVEVTTAEQACAFAAAGAEALQLEHFSASAVAECKALLGTLGLHPLLLAAGGVTESNAADYVRAGADVLVSSAPYQARPSDVKVVVQPVRRSD